MPSGAANSRAGVLPACHFREWGAMSGQDLDQAAGITGATKEIAPSLRGPPRSGRQSDRSQVHQTYRNAVMPAITVRNLPEGTRRALRLRAAQHGRSTEAEVRAIL